jgi:hypothetical protein
MRPATWAQIRPLNYNLGLYLTVYIKLAYKVEELHVAPEEKKYAAPEGNI